MTVSVSSIIIVTLMIVVLPLDVSYALPPSIHLFQRLQTNVSPSPNPSHGGLNFHCGTASRSCQLKNLTACLTKSGPDEETGLFVQNNGENPLHVKVTILPSNDTIEELELSSHEMQKINISSDADLSSAIALKSSNGDCVIDAAAVAPAPENNHYQKFSFSGTYITPINDAHQKFSFSGTYITPINGAYLGIVLILIGGVLTYYKKRIWGRHLEGVAYHELEMGDSTALNVEENQKLNWDQDWDDEWGDEKPIKADGDNLLLVEQAIGLTTKSPNLNGKRKEWTD